MAYSNIDIQKFLTNKSDTTIEAIEKKCSDSLLLNMLEEGLYADVTFQEKGGTVKAHWSVLATASSVFREMFQHEMKALQLPFSVNLPDMAIESLQLFLVLLYITNVKTRAMSEFNAAVDRHFAALFDATLKFEVEGRLDAVLKSGLLRHLTPENCWDFYHKCNGATWTSDYDFPEVCLSYVMKNIETVMKSETTVLEMQREPKLVQRCIVEAMSNGSCESCRQRITPKRKTQNA